MEASKQILNYFGLLNKEIEKSYNLAKVARKKGFDPVDDVEIVLAENMAERVEGLISTVAPQIKGSGMVERLGELEKEYGMQDWRVAFKIAEEVAVEKFCKFRDKKEAMEVGLRVGLAYITVGVVASPLEGFVRLELRKRRDGGGEYFALFFSGPIRSAGTTATCVFVALSDYVRRKMGYGEYDPDEIEIKRYIMEVRDFHERVTNLQYYPSEQEIEFMMRHLPVQISGDASETVEVSNYKDLDRFASNYLSNGICLVIGEGLTQKGGKFWKKFSNWCKDFEMKDWKWMSDFVDLQKKIRSKGEKSVSGEVLPDYNYLKDLVAGRPIIGYPMRKGGLRLRYGRSRVSGLSSTSLHPATMVVLDCFIANGTQLKMERPGKSTTLSMCDSVEGPIVKLKDGSVVLVDDEGTARKISKNVEEILFLGDILINYGDFFNRGHKLVKPGYCEEWWLLEFENAVKGKGLMELSDALDLDKEVLKKIFKGDLKLGGEDAVKLSMKLGIPLHPRYTYHWNDINREDISRLIDWLIKKMIVKRDDNKIEKIILPFEKENLIDDPKRILEFIGLPHIVVTNEYIVIERDDANGFAASLGFLDDDEKLRYLVLDQGESVLEIIKGVSLVKLKDKSGFFIGARMGRPEKGKMRKLIGSPHCLFPVGEQGGKMRSLQSALEKGYVKAEFSSYFCEDCVRENIFPVCDKCGGKNRKVWYCEGCGKHYLEARCEKHGELKGYRIKEIDLHEQFTNILYKLKIRNYPDLIKGVRGTSNLEHIPENLAKGVLRASEDVYVNRDGTTRYDMTEMCITHFKPREIGISIEQLKLLGYENDVNGNEIQDEDQLIEIMPQDIILPNCEDSFDDGADEVLFRVSRFVDNLLEKFYGMEKFYELKDKKELIGHLVLAMSPHTSAGVVCRIIGFSKLQGLLAHPLLHSIMRRDCLDYNTNVPVYDGKKWRNVKIGEYVEGLNPNEKIDFYGTLSKKVEGLFTLGFNPRTGKIEKVKINEFTKHSKRKTYRLKLEFGREIVVTDTHKFFVLEKGAKIKKKLRDLKIDDHLILPYRYEIAEKNIKEIDLIKSFAKRDYLMVRNINPFVYNIIKALGGRSKVRKHLNITKSCLDNYLLRDSFPFAFLTNLFLLSRNTFDDLPKDKRIGVIRNHVSLPTKIPLNKDVLRLIGLYVAEGYSRKVISKKGFYQVYFSATEEPIILFIERTMKKYFGLVGSKGEDRLVYCSRLLYDLFVDILKCGSNAYNKRIPEMFLDLSKEKLRYFLQGYFDGDGSVSKSDLRVSCDTVSEGLIYDLDFVFGRFGIPIRKYYYETYPGNKVKEFYLRKKRKIPKFGITKLTLPDDYCGIFYNEVGFGLERKQNILEWIVKNKKSRGMKIDYDKKFIYPKIKEVVEEKEKITYCLNVENHTVLANNLLVSNCDGDEACVVLLMDALLNFSRKLLPGHRGARQDAPLVLTTKLIPAEVDDMVFDMDVAWRYPLEFYEAAEKFKDPWEVNILQLNKRLETEKQYEDYGFTHSVNDINAGVLCSSYKKLPTMKEKVLGQMELAEKIRAVDENDVARLVIERHFMRDIRGNLRKFSQQQFRCVDCNMKFRRVPLAGVCSKCHGKIIFTIAEGSIVKYIEPAMSLIERYDLPVYLRQTLELTKNMIESIFLQEKEKQMGLGKWFVDAR